MKNPTSNSWYLLATSIATSLGGVDKNRAQRNRNIWNRYVSRALSSQDTEKLKRMRLVDEADLEPIEEVEIRQIWQKEILPTSKTHDVELPNVGTEQLPTSVVWTEIEFERRLDLSGYIFPMEVYVHSASFLGTFNLQHCVFLRPLFVANTEFRDHVSIQGSTFSDSVHIISCEIKESMFAFGAHFQDESRFSNTVFHGPVNFYSNTFYKDAKFSGASFDGYSGFSHSTFYSAADFMNSRFSSTTDFSDVSFGQPPAFQGAKMHPDTIWPSQSNKRLWPRLPKNETDAMTAERAWASLKWTMNQVQRHDAELEFFARELDAKRAYVSFPNKLVLSLFSHFSDYGRSALRPFLWWVGTWAIAFSANYLLLFERFPHYAFEHGDAITDFTFGNAFSLGGTYTNPERRQELADRVFPNGDASQISPLIDLFSLAHSFASLLFLFLIGLALRNRLRIK